MNRRRAVDAVIAFLSENYSPQTMRVLDLAVACYLKGHEDGRADGGDKGHRAKPHTVARLLSLDDMRRWPGLELMQIYKQPHGQEKYRFRWPINLLRKAIDEAELEIPSPGHPTRTSYPAAASRTLRHFIKNAKRSIGEP